MSCNFTIHYIKNYLAWANYQTRAIQLELLDQTHFHTKIDFRVIVHMNSKTLGFIVPVHSSNHRFTLGTRILWSFPALYTSTYELLHNLSHNAPKQSIPIHELSKMGAIISHTSVPSFGTDQMAVQGLNQPKHQHSS